MPWQVEYGLSRQNMRWYWRLINREHDPPWIAAEGGGGPGHATMQKCWEEIQTAKRELFSARIQLVRPYS
jgi:hypothetical protein